MFRAVNEQLTALNEAFAEIVGRYQIACECADTSCIDLIEVSPDEYQAVRSEPRRFIVRPGHVYPEVEVVVRETFAFVVVEKIAAAAEMAELLAEREAAV